MERLLPTIFFFNFRYRAIIMRLTMVILVSVIRVPYLYLCITFSSLQEGYHWNQHLVSIMIRCLSS